jgi:putative transposase
MTQRSPFRYFKTSPEIIRLAVMLYVRYPLSLRNVDDLLPWNVRTLRLIYSPAKEMDMKRSKFTEEQIIGVLKEHQAGAERCGVVPEARDQWCDVLQLRSKFGGMKVSEAERLKQLEDENAKLKKLLADSVMDASTLREMLGKNA